MRIYCYEYYKNFVLSMLNRMFDKVKLLLFLLSEWCFGKGCTSGLILMVNLVCQDIKSCVAIHYPNSFSGP